MKNLKFVLFVTQLFFWRSRKRFCKLRSRTQKCYISLFKQSQFRSFWKIASSIFTTVWWLLRLGCWCKGNQVSNKPGNLWYCWWQVVPVF